MYGYPSCNPLAKVAYRPIDAALRWCNLMAHETQVLKAAWHCPVALAHSFPQWPCLHTKVEKILDAVRHHELPYGCLGITVPMGTAVDPRQLTVRHIDLKQWMLHYYPDQRPAFLFGQPQDPPAIISIGTYLALQADRDALHLQLKQAQTTYQEVLAELQAIGLERENLKQLVDTQGIVSLRSELVYLRIIGALLALVLGHSPAGNPLSVFDSQAAIVSFLVAHHGDLPGISKRTLDEKFAAARRALNQG